VLAGVVVRDRRLRRALRRLADEHRAGLRRRLDPRGGVDEVARDHPLTLGAKGDGRLAAEHPRADTEARIERRDRADEVERGANGPLRVVLVRDRRAPERHHRVAYELLHGAAVPLDRGAGEVEVAGQQFARVLGVPSLGGGREPDEVREEHRHEPALGLWLSRCRAGDAGIGRERSPALAAELHPGRVGRPAVRACHGERRAAFAAELPAGVVCLTADPARHVHNRLTIPHRSSRI